MKLISVYVGEDLISAKKLIGVTWRTLIARGIHLQKKNDELQAENNYWITEIKNGKEAIKKLEKQIEILKDLLKNHKV